MLLTSRPEFEIPWSVRPPLSVLALPRLSRDDVNRMLGHLFVNGVRAALPGETVSQLISRADGIPLFVEELAHMVLDVDESSGTSAEGTSRTIPETLQDSLMARLDRLGDAKGIAQIAAVIGREFSVPLLERISDREPSAIRNCLNKLSHAGVVFSPSADGSCLFKHALLRDAAYHSLLKSARRRCHARIADELINTFPDLAERQPEVLARHYTEADRPADAIEYWRRAGRQALACFANQEAVAYAQDGLALIKNLEETPNRLQLELELQLALGPPLMALRGYADPLVAQAYGRARELARQLGDPPALYPVLFGLWTYHCVSARHVDAARIAMELTELAQKAEQPGLMLEADVAAGITHFYRGEFRDARERLARVDQFYDAVRDADHAFVFGQDPRAAARAHLTLVEWTLGDFAAAQATGRNAVALAEELTHPFSVSYLLAFAAWLQNVRGDFEACHQLATRGIEVSGARALIVFLAFSEILYGSALVNLGQHEDGLERLEVGMSRFRATASELILPFWSGLRAQAYAAVGRAAEGLVIVNEALAMVQRTGERHGEAELYRIRGELLSMTGGSDDAVEAAFRQALDTAAAQDARGWALRAATSQYRHLSAQGRAGEARSILTAARDQLRDFADEPDIRAADLLLAAAN
jgi:predicted ATPase